MKEFLFLSFFFFIENMKQIREKIIISLHTMEYKVISLKSV